MIIPKLTSFFSLILSIFVITGLYTNCAKDRVIESKKTLDSAEAAYVPLLQLQKKLGSLYGSSLTPTVCNDSERYFCDHRVYSPDVTESKSQVNYPCVELKDIKICSRGLEINIDSSQLAESCLGRTCSPDDIDYSEYFCYLAIPNENGTFPIQGTYSSLTIGVEDLNNQCLGLSGQLNTRSL
jgi:hypothetical protein